MIHDRQRIFKDWMRLIRLKAAKSSKIVSNLFGIYHLQIIENVRYIHISDCEQYGVPKKNYKFLQICVVFNLNE